MKIHKVINNINQKSKPKFNMMTKSPLRKQIIIPMSIIQSNMHIVKINRLLKEVKSEILANYIHSDNKEIVIITNKIVMNLILWVGYKNNSCIRETQENSIEFLVQSSLPYILLLMVHANYCAPTLKTMCIT